MSLAEATADVGVAMLTLVVSLEKAFNILF